MHEESIIELLQDRVVAGDTDFCDLGDVNTRFSGDFILFKYTPSCGLKKPSEWTPLELVSRGLIMDRRTGAVVARPFDKFFNFGEEKIGHSGTIDEVYEKVDGSLGIFYRDPGSGEYRIATNGSFESEQAKWATEVWNAGPTARIKIPFDWTLLAEIIYPENRIVVDYEGWAGFVILGARNRITGKHIPMENVWSWLDEQMCDKFESYEALSENERRDFEEMIALRRVKSYGPKAIVDLLIDCAKDDNPTTREGWVARMADGHFVKFKTDEYIKLHRIISGITEKNIWESMLDGTDEQTRETIPNEIVSEFDEIRDEILRRIESVEEYVTLRYEMILKELFQYYGQAWGRKQFAMLAKESAFQSYIFLVLKSDPEPTGRESARELVHESLRGRLVADYYPKMVKKWGWFDKIDKDENELDI